MDCPACATPTEPFAIPPDLRPYAPGEATAATLCPACLTLSRVDDEPVGEPSFAAFDGFPDGEAGVALALFVGLLESLALYRAELAELGERVERAGVDPLLVLERLAADPGVDATIDLERRLPQVEQLLYE